MNCLEKHVVAMNCKSNNFHFLDEMAHKRTIKEIPHGLSIRPIFPLPLKQNTRKGCEIFFVHINESVDIMVDHLLTNDPRLGMFQDIISKGIP
jgi:hypothetical protein